MYVGLKKIQNLFYDYPSRLTDSDGLHCLTGWNQLSSAPEPYASYLLYVCTDETDLTKIGFIDHMHVLCIITPGSNQEQIISRFPDNISLLLIESAEPVEIYTALQDFFNRQCGVGMFGQTLLDFLSFEDGLQSSIEYAYNVFHNPVFVFDTNYNLIAATWKAIEELGINDSVISEKRFSEDDFKMANREHNIHSKVLKSEIPIIAFNKALGYEQMYCTINTQKNLGHIVISAVNKPFEPIDKEFMLILKKYVDQLMKKDTFIRSAKGFNYEYFLRDLLDKKIDTGSNNSANMKYTEITFSGNMYCMVIETARSTETVNINHIRNIIESRFPYSKTLIYNEQIVIILSFLDNQYISDEYLKMGNKLCLENGLFAGISNCFENILELREYYAQALRAIEFGARINDVPALYPYWDYYLQHVISQFLIKESGNTFCHPKMKLLLDYDKTHHSELAYTLYMYLIHERNLAADAEAMEMHRTSLVYRFKKISSLIDDNFDNYKERLYLILSYEMNKY
ncbi:MAG: PucR family transcriptional regulator [Eubacterium sp.]|jgi:sugar diacid utilization regulator